VLDVWYSEALN